MAEVRLSDVRIGFPYTVEITFPAGFLAAEESVRMKFRRYVGDPDPVVLDDTRAGDSITLELTEAQTADMVPCSYIGEAIVYTPAAPLDPGIPLTNNRYIANCDYSPSE